MVCILLGVTVLEISVFKETKQMSSQVHFTLYHI